jgi:hypothetical protein
MPRGDRTGPMGMGPMTGRGAGFCAGLGMPGYANPAPARGLGMNYGQGRGFGGGGRGRRNMFYATGLPGWMRFGGYTAPHGFINPYEAPSPDAEKRVLRSQASALQSELDFIKKRLEEIESGSKAE